jgi:hypothetical protein
MELSYQLQTLEPLTGAFDIIRYLGKLGDSVAAYGEEIQDELNLSDRSFDKAIRRLSTKQYIQMDTNRAYRLTERGLSAFQELTAYDEAGPIIETESATPTVTRRLVVALPQTLVAGKPANVLVGFLAADNTQSLEQPVDVVVRLSVVNGEPTSNQDASLALQNGSVHHAFRITPGNYTQMRIRVQSFQLDPYSGDVSIAGGFYVDADITGQASSSELVAYGTDVNITPA